MISPFKRNKYKESDLDKCPADLRSVILEIIYYTSLEIRHCTNLRVAQVMASHIHNLPTLLGDYSVEKLSSYWPSSIEFVEAIASEEEYKLGVVKNGWSNAEPVIKKYLKGI